MRSLRRFALRTIAIAAVGAALACRDPTQAIIVLSTTAKCDDITAVAIGVSTTYARAEADVNYAQQAASSTQCIKGANENSLGTLLVTPGSPRGAVFAVAGLKSLGITSVAQCQRPRYTGCMFASRAFTFVEGETQRIPLVLDPACGGCAQDERCERGRCVCDAPACATVTDAGALHDASDASARD